MMMNETVKSVVGKECYLGYRELWDNMGYIGFMSFLAQMLQQKRELSKRVDLVKMI